MTCQYLHKSSSVAVDTLGTALVVTFADNPTGVADMQRFCFCVQQAIPAAGLSLPVEVAVNGTTIPLWNKFGDIVLGADLPTRYVLKGWYGADNDAHIITSSLPKNLVGCVNACY